MLQTNNIIEVVKMRKGKSFLYKNVIKSFKKNFPILGLGLGCRWVGKGGHGFRFVFVKILQNRSFLEHFLVYKSCLTVAAH
jgi:hypothetical protein